MRLEIGRLMQQEDAGGLYLAATIPALTHYAGENTSEETRAEILRMMRAATPASVNAAIADAKAMLAKGWSAQTVAASIRHVRRVRRTGGLRGSNEAMRSKAVKALWAMAMERARILDVDADMGEVRKIAAALLSEAADRL